MQAPRFNEEPFIVRGGARISIRFSGYPGFDLRTRSISRRKGAGVPVFSNRADHRTWKPSGVEIDEASAAWIQPDGRLRVLGEGLIQIYDARKAQIRRITGAEKQDLLGVNLVTMDLPLPGESFDLGARDQRGSANPV